MIRDYQAIDMPEDVQKVSYRSLMPFSSERRSYIVALMPIIEGLQYAVILTGHVTRINSKINKQIPALTLMVYCKSQISAKSTTNMPLPP